MLIPFADYCRQQRAGVFKSMAILDALLLLSLITKTQVTPAEWVFAISAITGALTFAVIRDLAGSLAYALEAPKFYLDEADFARLARYHSGWRWGLAYLVKPQRAAAVLAAVFAALSGLPHLLDAGPGFRLWSSVVLLVLVYPLLLSHLVHFLAPLLIGWKEISARAAPPPETGTPTTLPRQLHSIAAQDLTISALITLALVLPLRHSADFQPALGYGTPEFTVAALVLVMIVLPLSLVSAWRPRRFACTGDLYRHPVLDLSASLPPTAEPTNRWQRWCRYSLVLCALTLITCLTLRALPLVVPIELILILMLLPIAPIFWRERTATLMSNFHDAAEFISQYPARPLSLEQRLANAHRN